MISRAKQKKIIDPAFLIRAYAQGFFPMADSESGEIAWYSPEPRAIMEFEEFSISRSLRQTLKKEVFSREINRDFEGVIRACRRPKTWISETIVQSYVALHRKGFAHSVEAWRDDCLAGGLYGVAVGGAFFGESMFSVERDASKVALCWLVERLRARGFLLLDIQFLTPHLEQFGAREIPRSEYLQRLAVAVERRCSFVES